MKQFSMKNESDSKKGQTALSLVFVIGGIIVLFSVTLALLALSFLNSTYGFQAANRAAALAEGGVNDAMLQLLRDKDFSSAGYCLPYSATLPCPTGYAHIVVTQDTPEEGKVTVTSDVTVLRYERSIEAVFSVNATSGLVQIITSQQVSI
jgi:hypothetical protein